MARQRTYEDHALTQAEKSRRHLDKVASIDEELDEALNQIDWERRNKASGSLVDFITTYFVGLMIDDAPSPKFVEVLTEMEAALFQSRPYNIELPRGQGKTSAAEMAALYLLATGKRKFCVVVSNNARAAGNILKDIWRPLMEKDTAFAHDFPEICVPFQLCGGAYRRRQLYRGESTELAKNAGFIQFPRLRRDDGTEFPTSGSVVTVRGITSGIRGLKIGKLRPDTIILDDLQSSEQAENPEQVDKILDIIRKDVFNLSGKGKMAIMMTSTPIAPEDLCDKIETDPTWKTTKYSAIISWPKDMEENGDKGLWGRYFRLYDAENADDKPHDGSLKFYEENRAAMDEGVAVFNPNRFLRSDGHVSAIQALLEKRHAIGDAAFSAEMQMKPKRYSFQLNVTPRIICSRANGVKKLHIPDGYVFVSAATDLNVSYAASTTITAFKPDMTSHVLWHEVEPSRIDGKLNDAEYGREVVALLARLAAKLKGLGVKLDGWAIDAGSRNWDAVCSFARSPSARGLPACAFAGRSANVFNPLVRSRLRDAQGRTVLCGDAAEHVKAGAGQKYVFFDADFYKEAFQRAILSEPGAPGACSLYDGDASEHSEFAIQACNEKLVYVKHMPDGRNRYEWKSAEPHDFLDCMSMCYAVAASKGITGASAVRRLAGPVRNFRKRPRVRVV